jgi:peptidyl-prolyl cis-trans isomerase D
MSIITTIRGKAGLLVALIGLALVSFLAMDVFTGNGLFSQRNPTDVGSINGDKISLNTFDAKLQENIENYKANTKTQQIDEATMASLRDQVWNELIRENLMGETYEGLGLEVGQEELFDMVQGKNLHPEIQKAFADPASGQFDRNRVVDFLKNLAKQPADMQKRWKAFEDYILKDRATRKYANLVSKSMYVPDFFADEFVKGTSQTVTGRYAFLDYASISDTAIKISDAEYQAAYERYKASYRLKDPVRSLDFVTFEVVPSAEDTARARQTLTELREAFATTTEDSTFVSLRSDLPYDDRFVPTAELRQPALVALAASPKGTLTDLYLDNGAFVLSKLSAVTTRPDSVKARHILLKVENQPDTLVKAKADSLLDLVRKGVDFAALATSQSADPGSAAKGGDLGYFAEGMMVKPFNDACFGGRTGDYKIVRSEFGYHLIHITDQKGQKPVVKIASVAARVVASTETFRDRYAEATQFIANLKTADDFQKAVDKKGLPKRNADNVKIGDRTLPGISNAREVVRWAYKASKDELSPLFETEDRFVVAVLTKVFDKGYKPMDEVKTDLEQRIRKDKKGEMLSQKWNLIVSKNKSLDAAAAQAGTMVQPLLGASFLGSFINGVGQEPKLAGALFATPKGRMSKPVAGERGVFLFVVDSLSALPQGYTLKTAKASMEGQYRGRAGNEPLAAKREMADVQDDRHLFY